MGAAEGAAPAPGALEDAVSVAKQAVGVARQALKAAMLWRRRCGRLARRAGRALERLEDAIAELEGAGGSDPRVRSAIELLRDAREELLGLLEAAKREGAIP
jgi:hypothetical protein